MRGEWQVSIMTFNLLLGKDIPSVFCFGNQNNREALFTEITVPNLSVLEFHVC